MRTRKRGSALGLVEVLISSFILLAAVSSSVMLYRASVLSLKRAESALSASFTLQGKMEELRATEFAALDALDGSSFDGGRGSVSIRRVSDDLRLIDVSYGSGGRNPMSLQTLRSGY